MNKNITIAGLAAGTVILIVAAVLFVNASFARANPSLFVSNTSNSVTANAVNATTTVAYMSAGRGTTTIALNGGIGSGAALDSAKLILYRNANGTGAATNIAFEFSPSCYATYPEWFADKTNFGGGTTTQQLLGFTGGNQIVWQYSTTTIGGVLETGGTNSVDKITLDVPTPTNCVRAVLTVPVGAASSSIWGEIVGKKQQF